MNRNLFRRAATHLGRPLVLGALGIAVAACGSSSSRNNPPLPSVDIEVDSQLVDVGEQYRLDAGGSYNPEGNGELTYFWTLLPPLGSDAAIQDHCEDDFDEVCTRNYDACATDATHICTTNADCGEGGQCIENLATTSPDCSTGACGVGDGRKSAVATFVADRQGPFIARVLVSTSEANNIGSVELDTYPSLFLLGSLLAFGGTHGSMVAEFADAEVYAEGAVALTSRPSNGNVLLAIPAEQGQPGRVLEFASRDGRYMGLFGETSTFTNSPRAMAFDSTDRLFVANTGGRVQVFDDRGRFIRELGNVAAGVDEQVTSIAFSPDSGELLVVDGRPGAAVRRYDPANGQSLGVFGSVETVAQQAVDLAFFGDPATDVFVADAGGALVRCDADGDACEVVAAATPLLADGGPTAVAVNPAARVTEAEVLVSDAVKKAVIACGADLSACSVFGDTEGLDSQYLDLTFAPPEVPEVAPPPMVTTTTLSTTTTVP